MSLFNSHTYETESSTGRSGRAKVKPSSERYTRLTEMKTLTQVNVDKFYARLNAFCVDGEFTDVTIECADGGESFKCHRLALATASDYFKGLFRNSINEHTAECIVLREVNAVTFQEVLRFIYTGDARIDCDNFWDVLRASEFFCLSNLRDSCISFVKQNIDKFTVQNFLSMYLHAHENEEDVLTNILRPRLVDRLEVFCDAKEFLELPFNALKEIVKQRLNSSAQTNSAGEEAVVAAITRWVLPGGSARSQDDPQLVNVASYQNIKPEIKKDMTTGELVRDDAIPSGSKVSSSRRAPVVVERDPDLHIYVTFERETFIRVFSIDGSTGECGPMSTIFDGHSNQNFNTIALNGTLYRLLYYGDDNQVPVEEAVPFSSYETADMQRANKPLKVPPIRFEDVSLCAIRNDIYAYHKTLPLDPIRTTLLTSSGLRTFNDQEIKRSIFRYNCEVDVWFLVPEMTTRVQRAGMTALDDTLFLIGGYSPEHGHRQRFMQACDSREGKWRMLPITQDSYFETSACCLQGKIYVMGGHESWSCERYDPVAGRWEWLDNMVQVPGQYPKSIAYQDKIWHFDIGPILRHPDDDADMRRRLYFQTGRNPFDVASVVQSFEWSSESIDLKKENATKCVDSVVFKKIRI